MRGGGGSFGAEIGVAGAGWSWVPKTAASFGWECAEQPVFTHEWLHQVHWAYENLSGFTDLYGDNLPACRMGDPNPLLWFPDSHQCGVDPDFGACSSGTCWNNDVVDSHILNTHWNPAVAFVSNHCVNHIQDWGESDVDRGGDCLPGLGGALVASMPPPPPASSSPLPAHQ